MPQIEIIDLALYLKQAKALVISDVHMGYEEALNKQGILVPRKQYPETLQRLEKMFAQLEREKKKIDLIIINGDIKHEFGAISETEWRHTLRLLDYLTKKCRRIILIKGNHDNIVEPIARKRNVEIVDRYVLHDVLFIHGDVLRDDLITKKVKIIIIGHEHCAISITQWPRTEKFKCFLKGVYKQKTLIAMPSFNLVTEGTDVLKEKLLSPFLQRNLKEFEVYIVGDKEVLKFGKMGNVKG